ncbi:MAG: ABC transporter substrate-binding protein [Jatrophihabitans sp.]|uniref:ABC transporter substrate-binding protein n=1 Tax=Jatrophihabitans sp. TaxID=1932789 RepID=UPI00390E424C
MQMKRTSAAVAAVLALTTAAACSSSKKSGGSGGSKAAALPAGCSAYQAYAGHKGSTVTMFGSILSPESDSLNKSWAEFSKCTGITIKYTGSNTFESDLPVKVNGGNAPNLAIIPQPGLLKQMVATGSVKKPPKQTVANESAWTSVWKGYGSVNGTFYAAPMSANMKTMVWYSPTFFKQHNYTVPTTWADLMSLSAKMATDMKASGGKPWCGGIGSGTASGWPATDWLEETVLGSFGGQVYDDWVAHKVKFSDPQIQQAMKTMQNWMLNPNWVNGGHGDVKTIATTTFQNAGVPILKNKCGMLQQASFYEAQWPKGTKSGPDGDVMAFYLPPVSPSVKTPVEGGGEFVTAFSNSPAVQAVQNYLSTAAWAESRIKVAHGWVSANQKVDKSLYTDPIDQLSAKYLTDANSTFRFDASDLMPAAVGSGAEWKQMVAWFGQGKSASAVASAIDAAWPQ